MTKTSSPLPTIPLESELAPRQWAFVNHPLAWTDPAQAAKDVGYSDSFCQHRAYSLKKELEYYIRPKVTSQLALTGMGRNHVLDELTGIATSNLLDYFSVVETQEGSRLEFKQNLKALPIELQKAIKKIDTETIVLADGLIITVVSKIELHDKVSALKELVEILQMKQTTDPGESTELDGYEPQELEAMEKIMLGAAERARKKASQKRDRQAITVKKDK